MEGLSTSGTTRGFLAPRMLRRAVQDARRCWHKPRREVTQNSAGPAW